MFLMDLEMKGEKIPLPALIKKSNIEYILDPDGPGDDVK